MTSLLSYLWGTPKASATEPRSYTPPTFPTPGIYVIRSLAAELVIDLSSAARDDGTKVVAWGYKDVDHQKWEIADAGHGQFLFLNVATGTYLTADERAIGGLTYTSGSLVSPTNNRARWTIESGSEKDAYIIRNVASPAEVLSLADGSGAYNTPVTIHKEKDTKIQQWYLERLDAPPRPEVVKNTPVGGKGGSSFEEYKFSPVRVVEVWTGVLDDEHVIRGLQWTYDDGSKSALYGANKADHHEVVVIGPGEKVKSAAVSSGKRVDSISIEKVNGDKFKAGGDGGKEHKQDVGNGTLVGFNGGSGLDVDRIGFIFLKKGDI
ncbi:ricin B lectin domain-containing protein [Aspergillus avenaceus]|uniref:Ricin B lectin domain-containing protein n=1 Tax=Aspergillus avenaceus TaxID=36643 RepID=A0A5N6TZC9_ASPAV|nr:ricin B lectin domain-containing protein [Aspergillus avenaceus]